MWVWSDAIQMSSNTEFIVKEGVRCCGQYDNEWYRVQIEAIKDDKVYKPHPITYVTMVTGCNTIH